MLHKIARSEEKTVRLFDFVTLTAFYIYLATVLPPPSSASRDAGACDLACPLHRFLLYHSSPL